MTTMRVAGTLLATDPGSRTLTYRLLPYGEPGRTNLGVVTASRGTIRLPADPADLVLNLQHDRTRPVAVATALQDLDEALYATFEALPTTAGDDLLVEARAGVRGGASVELDSPVIRSGRLLGASLVDAGAVVDPAFPNARLVAADTGDDTPAPDTGDTHDSPPEQGDDTDDDTDDMDDDDDDTDSTDDSGADMTTTTPTTAAAAGPVATLTASRAAAPAGLPAAQRRPDPSYRDVVRFLADTSRQGMGNGRLFAALSDITPGAASVNDITQVPQWLGEVWDGRTFEQRVIPLLTHADLTAPEIKGWKWTVKPAVGPYTGNKADVPSNVPTTEPYTLTPTRLAGAHDVDRIFRDFNIEEFWSSYWAAMAESYSRQADSTAGGVIVNAAPYTAPGTVPAGVSTAASYIVDGALAIIDTAVPDFAIVAKDLYRDLLLTRNDDVLAYLNMALGLEDGSIQSFRVVPGDATFPAGSVLVGARAAATVYELPGGSPLRVEALDISQGGVDVGLFGYLAVGINDDAGLALVAATDPFPLADESSAKTAKK